MFSVEIQTNPNRSAGVLVYSPRLPARALYVPATSPSTQEMRLLWDKLGATIVRLYRFIPTAFRYDLELVRFLVPFILIFWLRVRTRAGTECHQL